MRFFGPFDENQDYSPTRKNTRIIENTAANNTNYAHESYEIELVDGVDQDENGNEVPVLHQLENVGEIDVTIGSTEVVEFESGADANMIQVYDGNASFDDSGVIVIDRKFRNMLNPAEAMRGVDGMGGINKDITVTINMEDGPTKQQGGNIDLTSDHRPALNQGMTRYVRTLANKPIAKGWLKPRHLGLGEADSLELMRAFFITDQPGDIEIIEVWEAGVRVVEMTRPRHDRIMARYGKVIPDNVWAIDPLIDGIGSDSFKVGQLKLEFRIKFARQSVYRAIMDTLGQSAF